MRSIKVLSTKKLTSSQREIIRNTNIDLVEYNAISVEKQAVKITEKIENAIITSQNAAQIIIESKIPINKVFCVGNKTTALLIENGYVVSKTAKNALELAQFIVKNHKNDSFVFFCGDKRRAELSNMLLESKIGLTEEILYKTTLNLQKFEEKFDGILFFSPSGVQSYVQENSTENSIAFCIGSTTAKEVKKHTSNIIISKISSVENVLIQVQNIFAKY